MKKNLKILIPTACLILAGASFGVTYAYLIANDTAVNEFSVGENDIDIVEDSFVPPEKLGPTVTFDKNPKISNNGDVSCFVRARIDFSDSEAEKFCELVGLNTTEWDHRDDGYYYYKAALDPGDETQALFTQVHIKEKYDAEDYGGRDVNETDMIDFDIMVYAESCQHPDHADGASCPDDEYLTVWEKEETKA
ncbi:MAG: hypothetical protein J1E39_09355 [Eubacterium sp.]|nr:hypothetical protein [Eubacterium sp.]